MPPPPRKRTRKWPSASAGDPDARQTSTTRSEKGSRDTDAPDSTTQGRSGGGGSEGSTQREDGKTRRGWESDTEEDEEDDHQQEPIDGDELDETVGDDEDDGADADATGEWMDKYCREFVEEHHERVIKGRPVDDLEDDLEKSGPWDSPSADPLFLQKVSLKLGEEVLEIERGGIALFFAMLTGPHLEKALGGLLALEADDDYLSFRLDWAQIVTPVPMKDCKTSGIYVFARDHRATGPYVGFTTQWGWARYLQHVLCPVNRKCAAERKLAAFPQWSAFMAWLSPEDVKLDIPKLFLMWLEHILITCVDATVAGLNIRPFDSYGTVRKATPRQVLDFFHAVIDLSYPLGEDGERKIEGNILTQRFFEYHHDAFHAITGLSPIQHYNIMRGRSCQWVLADAFADIDPPAALWGGEIPFYWGSPTARIAKEKALVKDRNTLKALPGYEKVQARDKAGYDKQVRKKADAAKKEAAGGSLPKPKRKPPKILPPTSNWQAVLWGSK
ncbi:hypothetical protein NBRC10512_000803 [Rhodotorula toruloides]